MENESIQESEIVDFSYVMELGEGRPDFIRQVLTIFMENTPPGLKELEAYIKDGSDWEKISKQAHFLKSSVGIVKVQGMYEHLQQIETLAKERRSKDVIDILLDEIVTTFGEAEKLILKKMEES